MQPMAECITILGDGAMATVCSILLNTGGHAVTIWGAFERSIEALLQDRENRKLLPGVKVPPAVRLTANDAEAFDGTTLIVSAVPTQYIRSVFDRLKKHLPREIPIVSVSKGIETTTLLRPTQIIKDALHGPVARDAGLCALSGPNIAGELARYLPGTAVAASDDQALARRVQAAFSTQWLRVYTNNDVTGVELAARPRT